MKRLAARASSSLVLLLASPLFADTAAASQPASPDWTEGLYWKIPFGIGCGIVVGIIVYVVKKPKNAAK